MAIYSQGRASCTSCCQSFLKASCFSRNHGMVHVPSGLYARMGLISNYTTRESKSLLSLKSRLIAGTLLTWKSPETIDCLLLLNCNEAIVYNVKDFVHVPSGQIPFARQSDGWCVMPQLMQTVWYPSCDLPCTGSCPPFWATRPEDCQRVNLFLPDGVERMQQFQHGLCL